MLKMISTVGCFVLAFAAPAYSMDPAKCDDASMTKMHSDMKAMNDPAMKDRKDMAMKEMDMAMTAMKGNKMEECTQHMNNAMMMGMAKCDDASMMQMQTGMDAMKDPAMKTQMETAMKEMDMAKTAMKGNKMDECNMHMGEAMKSMMNNTSK